MVFPPPWVSSVVFNCGTYLLPTLGTATRHTTTVQMLLRSRGTDRSVLTYLIRNRWNRPSCFLVDHTKDGLSKRGRRRRNQ